MLFVNFNNTAYGKGASCFVARHPHRTFTHHHPGRRTINLHTATNSCKNFIAAGCQPGYQPAVFISIIRSFFYTKRKRIPAGKHPGSCARRISNEIGTTGSSFIRKGCSHQVYTSNR